MFVIVELLPMDTNVYGPFDDTKIAGAVAMQVCNWPFQIKELQFIKIYGLKCN